MMDFRLLFSSLPSPSPQRPNICDKICRFQHDNIFKYYQVLHLHHQSHLPFLLILPNSPTIRALIWNIVNRFKIICQLTSAYFWKFPSVFIKAMLFFSHRGTSEFSGISLNCCLIVAATGPVSEIFKTLLQNDHVTKSIIYERFIW